MKIENCLRSAATLLKTLIMSRRPSRIDVPESPLPPMVVMGNGPSLRTTLDSQFDRLMACHRMGVNFAANAPEFPRLCPQHYILADPHFFEGFDSDDNVRRLWRNLAGVDWPMTLHIPASRRSLPQNLSLPECVGICRYNLTPGEGWNFICWPLFSAGLAMPRPRNVMIPAIMEAIRAGYTDIYLTGADHSWHQSLWVDDRNRVISVQPHFYNDHPEEQERVAREYEGYHLHDILQSMTIAFRSYHQIAAYAASRGVSITNATPGSMIDAFPRAPLPSPISNL